jgi:hypothetical protein
LSVGNIEAELLSKGAIGVFGNEKMDRKLDVAWALYQAGEFKPAEQLYRQLLAEDPDCMPAWERLGICYLAQKSAADATWLKQQYQCRVLAHCPARLRALLNSCAGIDLWVDDVLNLPPFDCYAPLMHVPDVLRHSEFPANVPYLKSNPRLVEQWKQILAQYAGLKIGITWQGSPIHEGQERRNVPLAQIAKLGRLEGVQLFSLQKGPPANEILSFPEIINLATDLDETTGAFVETAAVLENLDLLVTSDTSIAHLAGALALPVWAALCKVPDWRWGLTSESTPWYPTMRLFRQPTAGDWSSVMDQIATTIKQQFLTSRS